MKRIAFLLVAVATLAGVVAFTAPASGHADEEASPIYGVKIPAGYRDWKLIAVDHLLVADKVDQLRAQLGNDIAIKAFKEGKVPFPDGSIIAAIHWTLSRRKTTTKSWPVHSPAPCLSLSGPLIECSVHGQGLKEVRRDGRLGVC